MLCEGDFDVRRGVVGRGTVVPPIGALTLSFLFLGVWNCVVVVFWAV